MVIRKDFQIKFAHSEHLNIVKAIQDKKNSEAIKLLKGHIEDSTKRIKSLLSNVEIEP
jgi:DNA-binding GntR family transcriptional regulator